MGAAGAETAAWDRGGTLGFPSRAQPISHWASGPGLALSLTLLELEEALVHPLVEMNLG